MKTGECRQCGQRKQLRQEPFCSQRCAAAWGVVHAQGSNPFGSFLAGHFGNLSGLRPSLATPTEVRETIVPTKPRGKRPWWRRWLDRGG